MLKDLRKELKKIADPKRAKVLQGFFKTEKGEYGEGDIFWGITVPQSRSIAQKYKDLSSDEYLKLLKSKVHEERLVAAFLLVHKFQVGNEQGKKEIYNFYLKHTKYINNWDLVDLSADKIVGEYLLGKRRDVLIALANSKNLWERRIAVMATFQFIKKQKSAQWTFTIAEILLNDKHDLIQKAVGWMLREVGKRIGQSVEEKFLIKHYKQMPRTMLRYAVERFPKDARRIYLSK